MQRSRHYGPVIAVFLLAMNATSARAQGFGDDWDWGAIEAIDDTPVSAKDVVVRQLDASRRLSIEEVTAPDLQADPHQAYALFADMPTLQVTPSVRDSELYPCSSCHQNVDANPAVRQLDEPHDGLRIDHGLHGKGQFWCFTCHDQQAVGRLRTLEGELVAFEDAYILCSQCHVRQARDWSYGAHGKRQVSWRGPRQVYTCTACHYQHAPAIPKRDALPGPRVRMGLERPAHWNPGIASHQSLHIPGTPWQLPTGEGHE